MEHNDNPDTIRKPGLSGRALGLCLIFLTALIWVAASFISQLLVNTEEGRPSYNVSPFLLTYLSTSIFTIFLPLVQLKSLLQETWLLRRSFKYKPLVDDGDDDDDDNDFGSPSSAQQQQQQRQAPSSLEADLDLAEAAAAAEQASAAARASAAAHKESLIAAAQCFMLWFIAQYLFNCSLALTSVTSNTILSSTSSLFTFALSMLVLKEPYSCAKLLSIAACIGGTLLVTLSDNSSSSSTVGTAAMGGNSIHSLAGNSTIGAAGLAGPADSLGANTTAAGLPAAAAAGEATKRPSHSVVGDLLCLVSACFYAGYTIVLRKSLPDDDEANVALFFGYIGLLCSLVFAPVVAVLAALGQMHLSTIPAKAYLIILIEGILNYCLSDYLWAHAVLLLGPTVATLGLSVQIPVAAVVEVIMGTAKWLRSSRAMAMTLSGTGLIMVGFFAGNLAGGGNVYGSHHRGDADAQQCRRPSAADGFHFDGHDDDDAFLDSSTGGSVVIPVSTHAAVRDRSPVRAAAAAVNGTMQAAVQQQWSSFKDGFNEGFNQQLLQEQQQQQQQQQQRFQQHQQRASVEMSSLASSSSSSGAGSGGRGSISSPSSLRDLSPPGAERTELQADARPGSSGGSRVAASGVVLERKGQQQQQQQKQQAQQEQQQQQQNQETKQQQSTGPGLGGGSPSRQYKASRLQKSAGYFDTGSEIQ